MVSNGCSRVGVNVALVIENRKPVFFLNCPTCECQSLICVACKDVFYKGECTFPGAAGQETGVCCPDPISLWCAAIITQLGCTAEVLMVLLCSARAALSLMTRLRWMYFSLLFPPGKSGFLCRNHREYLRISFSHERWRQTRSFTSRNGICWYSPFANIVF